MANLQSYRSRVVNSLDDATLKYSNDILDEALRKVLNEYTRAFPNVASSTLAVSAAGRLQPLAGCHNLITVIAVVHPYSAALGDSCSEREDYLLTWRGGSPHLFFFDGQAPQVGDGLLVEYAANQTIENLDSAANTSVRDDHEDLLVVGAAGQAAMMRASGLTERWGHRPNETSALMLWGQAQYRRFIDFLAEVRVEQPLDIFPRRSWKLDLWDR